MADGHLINSFFERALRTALRNGSVYVDHSFSFRSLATLPIPADDMATPEQPFLRETGFAAGPEGIP